MRKEQVKAASRPTKRMDSSASMAYRVVPSDHVAGSNRRLSQILKTRVHQAKRSSLRGRIHAAFVAPWYITFDPQSRFRASWDIVLLLGIAFVAMFLPIQASRRRGTLCVAP